MSGHDSLWAPWRMQYIRQLEGQDDVEGAAAGSGCFICDAVDVVPGSEAARQQHVLLNDARGLVMLNRYPYTNGHLLIAPADHVTALNSLDSKKRHGLFDLVALGERLLQTAVNPQGMNIGMNLGRCAGAGLPGHLHVHIVPRWSGDTNYMQTIGHVRVIPQALDESYEQLARTLAKMDQ